MTAFAERVQEQMTERGMTQADLARASGKPAQMVSRILRGNASPQRRTVVIFARALGVHPGVLDERFRSRGPGHRRILDRMGGIDVAYLGAAMAALGRARKALLQMSPEAAVRPADGKSDSLLFDSTCESAIVEELLAFDGQASVLSEERNHGNVDWARADTVFFIDPFDRSTPFVETLTGLPKAPTLGDCITRRTFPMRGAEAPFGSVTCVRDGRVTFNAMIDYAGGELFVACEAMVRRGPIDLCPDPRALAVDGQPIHFEGDRAGETCACYLGSADSPNRRCYEESFEDLLGQTHPLPPESLQRPGGPARVLLLGDDPLLTVGAQPVFVLSNGEKITEWLGWLAYARFSGQLTAFELHARKFPFRDDVLLAPPPNYSVLRVDDDRVTLDLRRLASFENPSIYRGGIAVTHNHSLALPTLRALPNKRLLPLNPSTG